MLLVFLRGEQAVSTLNSNSLLKKGTFHKSVVDALPKRPSASAGVLRW